MNQEPRLQRMRSNCQAFKTRRDEHDYYARIKRHSSALFSCFPNSIFYMIGEGTKSTNQRRHTMLSQIKSTVSTAAANKPIALSGAIR